MDGTHVSPSSPLYERLLNTLQTLCGERMPISRCFGYSVPLRSNQGFSTLGRHTFWVHEASLDAEQCLFLVLTEGSYFFFRNAEDPLSPRILSVDTSRISFPVLGNLSRYQHQTLLDGEVVYNYHYNKSVFYVHDCIYLNGRRTSHFPLSKRLESLRDEFIQPLRQKYPDENSLPLIVMGKEYLPLEHLSTIFGRIQHFTELTSEPGLRFIYQNGKRYNENKGVVFVSESAAYNPAGRLEWLWPELFPVVFHVSAESAIFTLSLLVSPNSDALLHYRETVFELDSPRLLSDLQGEKEARIACIHTDGEFRYLHMAPVEGRVSTALSVIRYMEEVTTAVTRSQLNQLVERVAQAKSRQRAGSNGNSPYSANSPATKSPLGFSPQEEGEVVLESPLFGVENPRKRSLSLEAEQAANKRQKTAMAYH